jgi:DNA repair exonuclease SbcCD ATPase subunit
MLPKRIYLKNFMSHNETDIDCTSFDSCLIVGKSNDDNSKSNGVGKSTIFWAIIFALFDEVPTKKVNGIIRDGKEFCEVIFEFEMEGRDWQIKRVRSKTTQVELKEKINGNWESLGQRTSSQTNSVISDIIKINYKSFCNSVLFSQGSFSELAEATEGDRRKLLKEPLSLAIYSKYEKEAKSNLSNFETKYNKIKTIIDTIGNPKEDIKSLSNKLKEIEDKIKDVENNRVLISDKIKDKQDIIFELEKMLSSDVVKLTDKLSNIDKNKLTCLSNIKVYESQISEFNNKNSLLNKKLEDSKLNLSNLNVKITELSSKKLRTDDEIKEDLNKIQKTESNGYKYIASLQFSFEKFSKSLPEGSECETCFNELTDEYRKKISEENALKAKDILLKINESKEKMKILSSRKDKCNKERNDLIEYNREVSKLQLSLDKMQLDIKTLNDSIEYNELKISELKKSLTEENSKFLKEEELEKEIKKQVKDFNVDELHSKILSHKNDLRSISNEDRLLVNVLTESSSNSGAIKERISKRIEDLEFLKKYNCEIVELESKIKLWKKVVKAFSSTGIPTLIIHTILDDLQVEANSILQDLRPDISLQFYIEKEDKDVLDILYKVNGQNRDYLQLSGGQKTFVSFALKLGLSLVIQKRLGIKLQMLQLDEVDQPLDRSGQDAFVNVVHKYQNKFKIFVVTHNDRLKDKFSHAIMVKSSDNGSSGKLVSDW